MPVSLLDFQHCILKTSLYTENVHFLSTESYSIKSQTSYDAPAFF